jgi:dTDP-N-acetylfucosamine:lipid II N-acetylfucosaminyltransferase
MYIHIFTKESGYSGGLLNLIGKYFNPAEHLFVFKKNRSSNVTYPENIRKRIIYAGNLNKLILSFSVEFRSCRQLFFHYLPYGPSLVIWVLSPGLLRKSTWIIWGGDIYPADNYKRDPFAFMYEVSRRMIIKKIRRVAALIDEDYQIVKDRYRTDATFSQVLYPMPLNFSYLETLKNSFDEKIDKTILVGNSASKTNNHIDVLLMLAPISNKNIIIMCPLSYGGDRKYIDQVTEQGERIFGDKFVPMFSFIPPDEYSRILAGVDILIMNQKRQQGLGNILPLLFLEKKVYLRKDTTSFRFLRKAGCIIFETEEIEKKPDSILIPAKELLQHNPGMVQSLVSEENCMRLWKKLFDPE